MTEHVRNVSGECERFLSESQQDTWQIVMEARFCFKQVLKANPFSKLWNGYKVIVSKFAIR